MKRNLLLFVFLLLPSYLFSGVIFEKAEGKGNIVTWKTADESQVKYFLVFRRELQTGNNWGPTEGVRPDITITAKGQAGSIYEIRDTGIFKATDRLLEYEVQAVNAQGVVLESVKYSTNYNSGLSSAAKRTWGSIKSMFR